MVSSGLHSVELEFAWTDGTIDQIVSRLYGLGEEEISVVEGVNESVDEDVRPQAGQQ